MKSKKWLFVLLALVLTACGTQKVDAVIVDIGKPHAVLQDGLILIDIEEGVAQDGTSVAGAQIKVDPGDATLDLTATADGSLIFTTENGQVDFHKRLCIVMKNAPVAGGSVPKVAIKNVTNCGLQVSVSTAVPPTAEATTTTNTALTPSYGDQQTWNDALGNGTVVAVVGATTQARNDAGLGDYTALIVNGVETLYIQGLPSASDLSVCVYYGAGAITQTANGGVPVVNGANVVQCPVFQ